MPLSLNAGKHYSSNDYQSFDIVGPNWTVHSRCTKYKKCVSPISAITGPYGIFAKLGYVLSSYANLTNENDKKHHLTRVYETYYNVDNGHLIRLWITYRDPSRKPNMSPRVVIETEKTLSISFPEDLLEDYVISLSTPGHCNKSPGDSTCVIQNAVERIPKLNK